MIRRTFALTGAAVLALGVAGLAGPAAADDSGVAAVPNAIIAEFSVEANTALVAGSYVELENTSSSSISLAGYSLTACNASSGPVSLAIFQSTDVIAPNGGKFLLGNNAYDASDGPARDKPFSASVDTFLSQVDGGLRLVETSTPNEHNATWGMSIEACRGFESAPSPTDTQSVNWRPATETWELDSLTPENSDGV